MQPDAPRLPDTPIKTWRRHKACVDYRSWVLPLPAFTTERWAGLTAELRALGRSEQDATGVTTVRSDWGFLLIPPRGFPELRLSCYNGIAAHTENDLLNRILAALKRAHPEASPDEQ